MKKARPLFLGALKLSKNSLEASEGPQPLRLSFCVSGFAGFRLPTKGLFSRGSSPYIG